MVVAWFASDVPVKFDDFDYLAGSITLAHDWTAPFTADWFPHFRPGAYAVWWVLGRHSLAGTPVRVAQVVLWLAATLLALGLARRERGVPGVVMVAVLLGSMAPWWELLDWKSWITSLGTFAGFWAGAWAWRQGQLGWAAVAGLCALLFKETGAFALGWVLLLTGRGRDRVVGGVLVAAAVAVGLLAMDRVSGGFIVENLHFLVVMAPKGLGGLVPIAAALVVRSQPFIAALVAAMLTQVPELGGLVTLATAAFLLRRTPMWLLAAALCWAPSLFTTMRSQVYLLEGFAVVVLGVLLTRPMHLERRIWAVAIGVGLLGTTQFWLDRVPQRQQAVEQRQFLAEFSPEPARYLYRGRNTRLDLDILVWLQLGAEEGGPLPRGAKPVQVGPRSGVWADVTVNGEPYPR